MCVIGDLIDTLSSAVALLSEQAIKAVRERATERDRLDDDLSVEVPPDLNSLPYGRVSDTRFCCWASIRLPLI